MNRGIRHFQRGTGVAVVATVPGLWVGGLCEAEVAANVRRSLIHPTYLAMHLWCGKSGRIPSSNTTSARDGKIFFFF